jgi:hypothetical protein
MAEMLPVKTTELMAVSQLAKEMTSLDKDIKELEAKLRAKQDRYQQISASELPDLMSEIGMREFRLNTGEKLKIIPVLKVSVPKERMDTAEEWLDENGHSGLVKTKVEVPLPRSLDEETIQQIKEAISALGLDFKLDKSIHHMTLNKWGREMDEEGMVIPEDIFNVFRTNVTIIE